MVGKDGLGGGLYWVSFCQCQLMVHGDGENYLKGMKIMEPTIEIRIRDYCPIKREDLWACHRMSESEFLNLNQIGYVVGSIYRKLKHDIEAMKKQNKKNLKEAG